MKKLNYFIVSNEKKILFVFFFIFLIIGLKIYKDYGFNIDEKFQRANGFYWLKYLSNFFHLEELEIIASNKLNNLNSHTLPDINTWNKYGIIFDVPAAIIEVLFNINDELKSYQIRHLLTFLFFLLGSIFFYLLVRDRFKSILLGLLASIILITTPRLFGDSFHNNKDIIFLSLYIISIYFYFKFIDSRKKKDLIFLAFFSAAASTIRIIGIFMPASFFFLFLLSKISKKNDFRLFDLFFFTIFFTFFLYLTWPVYWENTYLNIVNFIDSFGKYGPAKILFLGTYYKTNLLPFEYFIVWILISSPIIYLIFFVIGAIFYCKRLISRFFNIKVEAIYNDLWRSKNESKDFLIFLNIITFLIFFSFFNVNQYNGWRLGYFVYIFIIYFIIYGLFIFLKKKNKKINLILISIFVIGISFNIFRISIYHPYQSLYFNNFVTKEIKNSVDVDFTGLSAIHFLNNTLKNEKNKITDIKIGVGSWYPIWFMFDLLDEDFKKRVKFVESKKLNEADYIYSNRIYEVDKKYNKKYYIPEKFSKHTFIIDNTIIYESYTK